MLPDNVLVGPPGPEADKAWEELERREFPREHDRSYLWGLTRCLFSVHA